MVDFRLLVKAGVHFGHQSSRWNPRMAPYIWGTKNNVHLINVAKTAVQLEKACKALEKIVAEGKTILWIGTKKAAQVTMKNAAEKVQMPYVTHRWIGGTLTNFSQVKKSVTRYLHFKDVVAKADTVQYTKKELNSFNKIVERLYKNIGGIVHLTWPIGAIIVIDVKKEHSAIKEANAAGIPVFALVDTNGNPLLVDYVIPGNDDSVHSIEAIVAPLVDAALQGKQVADAKKAEQEKELELLREKKRAERKEQDAAKASLSAEQQALLAELEKDEEDDAKGGVKKTTPGAGKKTFTPRREGGASRPAGAGRGNAPHAGGQKRTFNKPAGSGASAPFQGPKTFTPGPRKEYGPKKEFVPKKDDSAPKKD